MVWAGGVLFAAYLSTRVGNFFLVKIPIESALLGRVANFISKKKPIELDILPGL